MTLDHNPTGGSRTVWTVDHIETEPLIPTQHQQAVGALAALINEWNENPRSE